MLVRSAAPPITRLFPVPVDTASRIGIDSVVPLMSTAAVAVPVRLAETFDPESSMLTELSVSPLTSARPVVVPVRSNTEVARSTHPAAAAANLSAVAVPAIDRMGSPVPPLAQVAVDDSSTLSTVSWAPAWVVQVTNGVVPSPAAKS